MPMVEIDETELQSFRTLTGQVQKIMANPAARRKLLEAQKESDPSVVIPELDAAQPVMAELKKLSDSFDAFKAETAKEKTEREEKDRLAVLGTRWDEGRKYARAQAGYTDEGLTQLEKFMETHGVADHKIAIPAFERENPPPEPVQPSGAGSAFNIFGDKRPEDSAITQLLEGKIGENQFLDKAVGETLRDLRGGR